MSEGDTQTETGEFEPYQDGDFTPSNDSNKKKYSGPVWDVTYPPRADPNQELMDWYGLGYQVLLYHGNDVDGSTLRVLGDIPEWAQERFKKIGIECVLTKERGKGEPILV